MIFFGIFSRREKHKKWYHQFCVSQKSLNENCLACVAILLKFFKKDINFKKLKRDFPAHLADTTSENIIALCCENGIIAKPFSCSAIELNKIKLPCLLYWDLNRYVVLISIENDEYCVLDPAKSRIEYNFNDFECFFCEEGMLIESALQ